MGEEREKKKRATIDTNRCFICLSSCCVCIETIGFMAFNYLDIPTWVVDDQPPLADKPPPPPPNGPSPPCLARWRSPFPSPGRPSVPLKNFAPPVFTEIFGPHPPTPPLFFERTRRGKGGRVGVVTNWQDPPDAFSLSLSLSVCVCRLRPFCWVWAGGDGSPI